MKWFDRKFALDLPAWMYPNVVERLRGTPARAEELTRGIPVEILTRRDADAWSPQENIGHLLDLEPIWLGRVDDILSRKPRLRDADLTNRNTHEADHNAAQIADILRRFREARSRLVRQLDDLDEASFELAATHPRLEQPMRLLDLIFFVAKHDDHHFARVTRLLDQSSVSPCGEPFSPPSGPQRWRVS